MFVPAPQLSLIPDTYTSGQALTITASGGAQLKALQLNPNLLDTSVWQVGVPGSQGTFSAIGSLAENQVLQRDTPYGTTEKVWVGTSQDADASPEDGPDGGWNSGLFEVDRTRTYRFSVWLRKHDPTPSSTSGYSYLGCTAVSALGGPEKDFPNPYFWYGLLPLDEWCLVVGFIHPAGYAGTTSYGKVYNSTGTAIAAGQDFRWLSTTTSSYHRSYLFYCAEQGVTQEFWNPRVEIVNSVNDPVDVLFTPTLGSSATLTLNGAGSKTVQTVGFFSAAERSAVGSSTYQLAITDTDSDGLHDPWEIAYFGNLGQSGFGDPDADGLKTSFEFGNGLNPAVFNGLQVFTPLK